MTIAPVSAVLARMAALAAPPARLAQLQGRFGALLESSIADASGASAAVPPAPSAEPLEGAEAARSDAYVLSADPAPVANSGGGASWMAASALATPRVVPAATGGAGGLLSAGGGAIEPVTPRGDWVARVPNERGRALAPYIQAVADRYGLDPAFLAAVFWTESSYQADAVSSAGAVGLGQLMPATAQSLGVDPWDPMQNMDGSARLYRSFIDQYDGDIELAISAYACGPGAVARAGGVPSAFAANYITRLLGRRDYLAGTRASPP